MNKQFSKNSSGNISISATTVELLNKKDKSSYNTKADAHKINAFDIVWLLLNWELTRL